MAVITIDFRKPGEILHKYSSLCLHTSAFAYNVAINMINILLPLYIFSLGHSSVVLGLVVAAQGVSQPILRIYGGVFADRFGERAVLWFSMGSLFLSSILFFLTSQLGWLIVAQLVTGASRSVFFSASQSYASKLDSRGSNLGYLAGNIAAGNVIGFLIGGALSQMISYKFAFGVAALFAGLSFAVILLLPELASRAEGASGKTSLVAMLGVKPLHLAGISAFASATSFVLVGSFYPNYYKLIGFDNSLTSVLISGNAIGMAVVGFVFTAVIAVMSVRVVFFVGALGSGLVIIATTMIPHAWVQFLLMIGVGVTSGLSNMFYQLVVTEYSQPHERATAMSISGLYWAISNMVVPAVFGYMVAFVDLVPSFWITGTAFIALAFSTPLLFRSFLPEDSRSTDSRAVAP